MFWLLLRKQGYPTDIANLYMLLAIEDNNDGNNSIARCYNLSPIEAVRTGISKFYLLCGALVWRHIYHVLSFRF